MSIHATRTVSRIAVAALALLTLLATVLMVGIRPGVAGPVCGFNPDMTVDPGAATAGSAILVEGPSGSGWGGLTSVQVRLDGLLLGEVATGITDSWSLPAVVPDLVPGTYELTYNADPFIGVGFGCSIDFVVLLELVLVPGVFLPTTTLGLLLTIPTIGPATTAAPPTTAAAPATTSDTTATTAAPTTTVDATTTTSTDVAETTTVATDTTGTSLVAAASEEGGGGGGTLIGVLIGLAVAALVGGAWFLGRRNAALSGYAPPPPPPTSQPNDEGYYDA